MSAENARSVSGGVQQRQAYRGYREVLMFDVYMPAIQCIELKGEPHDRLTRSVRSVAGMYGSYGSGSHSTQRVPSQPQCQCHCLCCFPVCEFRDNACARAQNHILQYHDRNDNTYTHARHPGLDSISPSQRVVNTSAETMCETVAFPDIGFQAIRSRH